MVHHLALYKLKPGVTRADPRGDIDEFVMTFLYPPKSKRPQSN